MYHGVINVYKEAGYTSHDVVARLRGILKQKKIGHTGTLDPAAQGVLPVCLGQATRLCDMLTDKSKTCLLYTSEERLVRSLTEPKKEEAVAEGAGHKKKVVAVYRPQNSQQLKNRPASQKNTGASRPAGKPAEAAKTEEPVKSQEIPAAKPAEAVQEPVLTPANSTERSAQARDGQRENRQGGFNRDGQGNRQGGFNRDGQRENRQGGFNRDGQGNRQGGFNRDGQGNRQGGFNRDGQGNRQGGFNRDGQGSRQGGAGRSQSSKSSFDAPVPVSYTHLKINRQAR